MPIKTEIVVVDKQTINHDCYIFTLKFVSEPIQFSIGQHFRIIETIKTMANPDGEEVMRKYTPISPCQQIVMACLCRTGLMFLSRSIDQMCTLNFQMVVK